MKVHIVHIIVSRLREALEEIETDIEDTPEFRKYEAERMMQDLDRTARGEKR